MRDLVLIFFALLFLLLLLLMPTRTTALRIVVTASICLSMPATHGGLKSQRLYAYSSVPCRHLHRLRRNDEYSRKNTAAPSQPQQKPHRTLELYHVPGTTAGAVAFVLYLVQNFFLYFFCVLLLILLLLLMPPCT